jgi:nucleotidyltransferase/DNA polymerase involved in DNA repair
MSIKLNPTLTTKTKAKAVAEQEGRKRPVIAINEEGKLVVCCRRTAKKNGWEVQDVLYERARKAAEAAPEPVKAIAKKPQKNGNVTVSKAKIKEAKAFVDSTMDDILGK